MKNDNFEQSHSAEKSERGTLWDFQTSIMFQNINTEAKRCFATHDEDIDYFNMRIYIVLIACVYIQQFNFVQ